MKSGAPLYLFNLHAKVVAGENTEGRNSGEMSDDSDEEADAIIERNRNRIRLEKIQAEEKAAAAARDAAALSAIAQPGWGFAAKTFALRSITRRRIEEARRLEAEAGRIARLPEQTVLSALQQAVLTDLDWLWAFQPLREVMCFGALSLPPPARCATNEPASDAALHAFASCAAVCKAWRDSLLPFVCRWRVLVHGRQLRCPPPRSPSLDRPSFCELAPTGEVSAQPPATHGPNRARCPARDAASLERPLAR